MVKWIFALYVCLAVSHLSFGTVVTKSKKSPSSFVNKFTDVLLTDRRVFVYNSVGGRKGLSSPAASQKCLNDGGYLAKVTPSEKSLIKSLGNFVDKTGDWNEGSQNHADVCRSGAVWMHVFPENGGIS